MTNIKPVSILIMTLDETAGEAIISAFGNLHITFLKSKPSYANYLKTLQYLPGAIVVELPQQFHDQLHFIQMVKQNSLASDIPIVCFGHQLHETTARNLTKIGVDEYFASPFDVKSMVATLAGLIRKRGLVLSPKSDDPQKEKDIDISRILSVNVPQVRKVDLMVKHVSDIMAFPFTVSMTLQLLNSNKTNANDLAKTIETDPAISANFLKKANSVYIAGKNTRTITMKDAIVRIGFTETRRIITGMAVMQLFDASKYSPGFDRVQFWLHCVATAKIAELLAELSQTISRDEVFLAGILHDFGLILLDEFFPTIFNKVLQISTDYGMRFSDTEQEIISINHNDVVRRLFATWKIPDHINEAVVNHYQALTAPADTEKPADTLTILVAIANILAKAFRIGASCDQFVVPINNALFAAIRLPFGLPDNFHLRIIESVEAYIHLLKIEEKTTVPVAVTRTFHIGIVDFSASLCLPVEIYMRQSGHTIVPMTQTEPCDAFAGLCDIVLAFPDAATDRRLIESFTRVPVRQTASEDGNGGRPERFAPLMVLLNKQSPCVAAVNIAGISILPAAIDLRMLDQHIDAVVRGKQVKILPWESVLKPATNVETRHNDRRGEIQAAFVLALRWKTRCAERGIETAEVVAANNHLEAAKAKESAGEFDFAISFVNLALELYRKSYLISEIAAVENVINSIKTSLKLA